MLDLKFIRNNPEKVQKAIALKKGKDHLDRILHLDKEKRKQLVAVEELKALRNKYNEKIATARKLGENAESLIAEMATISKEIKELDLKISKVTEELENLLLWLPNIPLDDVPEGDERNNITIREWGIPKSFDFTPKPHWELGEKLGILEIKRAAKISGSGFTMLLEDGARLERALLNFMLDIHRKEHGYKEVTMPFLVTRKTITGTGQLPKLAEDMYCIPQDELFLIPTAEVPLCNFYQQEIIAEEQLPIRLMGASACFRREAGAHGKDTRGLLRVHQFNKVELVHFVRQEESEKSLEILLSHAETILQKLQIPYRVVLLATGDLSFASAKTYDLEIWAPGVQQWLEVSSCSICTDFQARRMKIRYKKKGGKPKFVHLLNGSGVALPRLIVAFLEHYQLANGKVQIPKVLQPYLENQEFLEGV